MRITCCKDCKEHEVGCHGRCKSYLAQKARLDKHREQKRDINELCRGRYHACLEYDAKRKQNKRNRSVR